MMKCTISSSIGLASIVLSTLLSFAAADVPSSSRTFNRGDASVAVNVPEGNSQDLYFHFEAPLDDENSWAAFGMGTGMNNALIFVAYKSGDDKNPVTLSPRIGKGHVMPTFTDAVNVTILPDTKVNDDGLFLNFKCSNCRDWSAGKVDVTSNGADFIMALGPAATLASTDKEAPISQHSTDGRLKFTLDMKAATGQAGVPVVAAITNPNVPNNNDNDDDDDDDDYSGRSPALAAHAFVMSLAFTLIFPLGFLLLRLFEKLWLHWGMQSFGFILVLLGVGTGIAVSKGQSISPALNHPHQIVGLITFAMIAITWCVGVVGHILFRKQNKKSPIMWVHRILGPLSIALGFINGTIGLRWAGRSRSVVWGYILFDLMVWAVILVMLYFHNKRKMRRAAMNTPAAWNARHGYEQENGYGGPPPYGAGPSVPLQNMGQQYGPPPGQPPEYYNVRPK